jgi:cytochrome c553
VRTLILFVVLCASAVAAVALPPTAEFPLWAYGVTEPPPPAGAAPPAPAPAGRGGGAGGRGGAAADPIQHRVPGSAQQFTRAQISNAYGPADWFPDDHPQMPDIVAKGDQARNIAACSLCHMPNGKGRPENAPVAGYPVEYFVKTMMDFKNDLRKSADPRKANTNRMIAFAKAMSDEEIRSAATYFAAMPWTQWIRVVEVKVVPKTRIQGGMFLRLEGNDTEPIGNRIIEAPEHTERTELLRDPRAGFVAYVPVGSVAKGEAIVKTGASKTVQCGLCHGQDLMGMNDVPGIAGRTPTYTMRQLWDIQKGTRTSKLMAPIVAKLSLEDMLNVTAYLASRTVSAAGSQ